MSHEITAEAKVVASLRPGKRISKDGTHSRKISLPRVADIALGMAIVGILVVEIDKWEGIGASVAKPKLLRPISGVGREGVLVIDVIGEVQDVQNIWTEGVAFAEPPLMHPVENIPAIRERPTIVCSLLPNTPAIVQQARLVVVNPGSGQAIPFAQNVIHLDHEFIGSLTGRAGDETSGIVVDSPELRQIVLIVESGNLLRHPAQPSGRDDVARKLAWGMVCWARRRVGVRIIDHIHLRRDLLSSLVPDHESR